MNHAQEQIRQYLDDNQYEGYVTRNENDIRWITGFKGSLGLYVQHCNEAFLYTDARYIESAHKLSGAGDEFTVLQFDRDTIFDAYADTFVFEKQHSLSQYAGIKKLFPQCKITTVDSFVVGLRATKTQQEIETITEAQAYVDSVLMDVMNQHAKEGISEQALAFGLETKLRNRGMHGLSFDAVVAFGENSAIPHHEPSDRELKQGDNILIDCGVSLDGYCSDMTRNFVLGTPSAQYKEKFDLLLDVQSRLLAMAKPGLQTADWHNACVEMLGDDAQYFTHSLGHGVGLDIHEQPSVSPASSGVLEVGQVVTCEPGLYYEGTFGIRIEDLLVIDQPGCVILSKTPRDLIMLDA